MKIREIRAKSIITKSNLPDADYVINPYIGCMHSCLYCYARFMKRFTGHIESWGKFVDVKINASDLIPAKTTKYCGKSIFLSSVTDPYLPLERKYKLTRKILEKLIPLQPNLSVLTKSDLVLHDIDLFRQFKRCDVGITITTLNDNLRKEIEPFASPVQDRINALKKLKDSGIRTYVFIGPILPFLTNWKEIITKTKKYSDFYMFENLNVRGPIWHSVEKWLGQKHPELLDNYRKIYFSKSIYWNNTEKEIKQFCKEQKVACRVYFH
ncbi:MAG: radical SAM protein [Candidatus Aenigmarchaeota archaeon]|nr:radical SAM protein [Candidatus Aenigmarchaeota archaeon]